MRIEHVAVWTTKLEDLKDFYVTHFGGVANCKYTNPATGFESYFVSFGDGCRLEVMSRPDIGDGARETRTGLAHIAFGVASHDDVDSCAGRLRECGVKVLRGPRHTGDGCYEVEVADPDGNIIEITSLA